MNFVSSARENDWKRTDFFSLLRAGREREKMFPTRNIRKHTERRKWNRGRIGGGVDDGVVNHRALLLRDRQTPCCMMCVCVCDRQQEEENMRQRRTPSRRRRRNYCLLPRSCTYTPWVKSGLKHTQRERERERERGKWSVGREGKWQSVAKSGVCVSECIIHVHVRRRTCTWYVISRH